MDVVNADFYNASGVVEENVPFSERSRKLFDPVRSFCQTLIFDGARVLEIGCGNGRFSFELERMGGVVTGVDCADKVVEYAQSFAQEINSTAEFVVCDAVDMPFQDGSFDVVCMFGNNIVEFSYRSMDVIAGKVSRMLRSGGVFCLAMNDMFIHGNGRKYDIGQYMYEDARLVSNYTIPGEGEFLYHSYVWTVGMAKFIFERYFGRVDVVRLDEKRFWIEGTL